MSSPRVSPTPALVAGLLVIVLSLALVRVAGSNASYAGGMEAISIDLDVSGNTATSLGPRDECIEVAPGDTVTLDVTAEGIPSASPMIAFSYELHGPAGVVSVIASDTSYLLASAPESAVLNVEGPTPDGDGRWTGIAIDNNINALEDGSGVLARLTISVSELAAPGLVSLDLSYGIHIDPMNEAWLAREHRAGYIALGMACANLPTPQATAIPTEAPTGVRVGIDHDGAPEDINPGPLLVPPGARFSLQVVAYWPDRQDANAQVTVWYRPAVIRARNCNQCSGLSEGWVDVGQELYGVEGYRVLTGLGFEATGSPGDCTRLYVVPDPAFHADATPGEVCIDPDAPPPTATPTLPPTPTRSFLTPTRGGPPTVPAQSQTPTATPTPTPSATATPSASPTPPATGTAPPPAALPATGGETRAGAGGVLVLLGAAAVAVGIAPMLAGRRR